MAGGQCSRCGGEARQDAEGKFLSYCAECERRYQREYKQRDKAKYQASDKRWRAKSKKRLVLKERRRTMRRHGMTLEDYDRMFSEQGGVCAICSRTAQEGGGNSEHLHVDHCHKTDVVRGLLCTSCNNALGRVKDDPERLRKMATYLEARQSAVVCANETCQGLFSGGRAGDIYCTDSCAKAQVQREYRRRKQLSEYEHVCYRQDLAG